MQITSKTGLLPTQTKKGATDVREIVTMEMPKIVAPVTFTLKPFAGVYNPFPDGCSILCNHPADFDAKSIVKRAKDAWSSEGKSLMDLEELSLYKLKQNADQERQIFRPNNKKDDNVSEEVFLKYTGTDSRPITPAPTLASLVTKNVRSRRCMTPDPTSFISTKEKTLLVLDLRRSHSQETVFWPGTQFVDSNFSGDLRQEALSRTTTISSAYPHQGKNKKNDRRKSVLTNLKVQTSKDCDSKVQTQNSSDSQSLSKRSLIHEQKTSQKVPDGSSEGSFSDEIIIKRRGKKTKRGKKLGKDEIKGEKEFRGIPDPGETQVSALRNDSKEGSSRPSLTGEEKFLKTEPDGKIANWESKLDKEKGEKSKSFLTQDALKQLQRQLDQELVDSELNSKRKIALVEALRYKKITKHEQQGEEMKNLKKEFQLVIKDSEKWLSIPRVFTRQSARFELPMDSRALNDMTPTNYVQNYVFASPERVVLYNHVFNLFKEDSEDEEKERILLGNNVTQALGKVMGRPMTQEEAKDFRSFLNWKDEESLDFRTFSGICATCERVMSPQFCSKMLSQKEDPRHEIERVDFETLDGKLLRLHPDRNLVRMLKAIRDL